MGVITKCCTRESIISNSQISLYSVSEIEDKVEKNKELPSNFDIESAFKFIISDKFYSLISQNIQKHSLIGQISKNMNINEIILLMEEILKYINNFEPNEKYKMSINIIKSNAKCSFEFLIKEMKNKKYEEKNNYYITRALSNICIILQSLLFLKNNEKDVYKINIWNNKDIIKESKKYGIQGAFFLFVFKNKKNENNSLEDKEKIKNELKQEINQCFKVSSDFCNDLFNF